MSYAKVIVLGCLAAVPGCGRSQEAQPRASNRPETAEPVGHTEAEVDVEGYDGTIRSPNASLSVRG